MLAFEGLYTPHTLLVRELMEIARLNAVDTHPRTLNWELAEIVGGTSMPYGHDKLARDYIARDVEARLCRQTVVAKLTCINTGARAVVQVAFPTYRHPTSHRYRGDHTTGKYMLSMDIYPEESQYSATDRLNGVWQHANPVNVEFWADPAQDISTTVAFMGIGGLRFEMNRHLREMKAEYMKDFVEVEESWPIGSSMELQSRSPISSRIWQEYLVESEFVLIQY